MHAFYVLELRHADGWIGYGAKIHEARFTALATPGTPLTLEANVVRSRRIKDSIMVRYRFEFRQAETVVYEGEQTAMWMKVVDGQPTTALPLPRGGEGRGEGSRGLITSGA